MEATGGHLLQEEVRLFQRLDMWPGKGLWPALRRCLLFSLMASFFVSMTAKVVLHFHDMDDAAAAIDFCTVEIAAIVRFLFVLVHSTAHERLVQLVFTTFRTDQTPVLDWYLKIANRCKLGVKTYLSLWLIQAEVPLDLSVPWFYVIVYFSQVVSSFYVAYIFLAVDLFWCRMVFLTLAQYDLLVQSLERSAQSEGDLITFMQQHWKIRTLAKCMDELLSPNILFDFFHIVISDTFVLYDFSIAVENKDWAKVIIMLEYFMLNMTHLFVFYYLGNELAVKEEGLALAVYSTRWYEQGAAEKRLVLMISRQAANPVRITGWKLFTVSMEFFVGIVKMVFSYYMIVVQMRH